MDTNLEIGKLYYWVIFHESDPALSLPKIHSLIYLGENVYPEDDKRNEILHYFQELESFQEHGSLLANPGCEEAEVYCFGSSVINDLLELPGLIRKLERLNKVGNLSKRVPENF
jgi:hypothetical protein